jgi:hypothetical protein
MQLDSRERHFLSLILTDGSIATGSAVGHALHERGMLSVVRKGRRYGITTAGILAITGSERRVVVPARA